MYLLALSVVLALVSAQQETCTFTGGANGEYLLNLTEISDWTMVLETEEWFAYYSPCGNRMNCTLNGVNNAANIVQFKQGDNQCQAYLAMDYQQLPVYYYNRGSWHFHYIDGQMCELANGTSVVSVVDVYYVCDSEQTSPAIFYALQEIDECQYEMSLDIFCTFTIPQIFSLILFQNYFLYIMLLRINLFVRSPLACVPEDPLNAKCQWKVSNGTSGGFYTLDLSSLAGEIIQINPSDAANGYEHFYTPCGNSLYCKEQVSNPVMCMTENHITGTCDHYLAVWESGRVQPQYFAGQTSARDHWNFQFWNGQKCSQGHISEYTIRFYCDASVDTYKVLQEVSAGGCKFVVDISTKLACVDLYEETIILP